MAETIGSSGGNAVFLDLNTSSTTTAINEGELVELDSSGNVVKCSGAATTKFLGVAAVTVRARTVASSEPISVQVSGVAKVYGLRDTGGTYTTAIVPGALVIVGGDDAAAYTGQVVAHAPDPSATDPNGSARLVGVALEPVAAASATPSVIKVLLIPGGIC